MGKGWEWILGRDLVLQSGRRGCAVAWGRRHTSGLLNDPPNFMDVNETVLLRSFLPRIIRTSFMVNVQLKDPMIAELATRWLERGQGSISQPFSSEMAGVPWTMPKWCTLRHDHYMVYHLCCGKSDVMWKYHPVLTGGSESK
ncbi:hypothetical protein AVEN_152412-1 [Araneus ventricosus]|uniref:Uncharacterized protein n=1 Tax=Araneus ventricosus TaxID=182803 RepID=A0A4Y2G7F7_ARAVE|nr:hypothetical protein AVEN_152412-1 [Araneus ventricosus]